MKFFKFKILMILVLSALAFSTAQAQLGEGRMFSYNIDTLTNADTLYTVMPLKLIDSHTFNYEWQVSVDSVSGTTAVTSYLQESLYPSGDRWVTVDTITFTASGEQFVTGTTKGIRQRWMHITSGTQVNAIDLTSRHRRKRF
jgi:hypothetical protein